MWMRSLRVVVLVALPACAAVGGPEPSVSGNGARADFWEGGPADSGIAWLAECPGYEGPRRPWLLPHRVRVHVQVRGDGTVEPGSPAVDRSWRYHRGGEDAVRRAEELAGGCRFHPARLGDDPAEMRVGVVFAFP
jgi:hypothetical protein